MRFFGSEDSEYVSQVSDLVKTLNKLGDPDVQIAHLDKKVKSELRSAADLIQQLCKIYGIKC